MIDRDRRLAVAASIILPEAVAAPSQAKQLRCRYEPWRSTWDGLSYSETQALAPVEAAYAIARHAITGRDPWYRLIPHNERVDKLEGAARAARPYLPGLRVRFDEFEHEGASPAIGVINTLLYHAVPVAASLAGLTSEQFLNPLSQAIPTKASG